MRKRLIIAIVVLLGCVVAGYIWLGSNVRRPPGHREVTRMQNKAWVEELFLREARSIARSDGGRLLIEFARAGLQGAWPRR